jgi:hypothetical protein
MQPAAAAASIRREMVTHNPFSREDFEPDRPNPATRGDTASTIG